MKKNFLLLFTAVLCCITAAGQSKLSINGTVTDALTGESLVGATLMETGTRNATVTDLDGKYAMAVSHEHATVTVSYIGYEDAVISITTAGRHDVRLTPSENSLDELVVVGYGSMKKSDLTGSLSSISGNSLRNMAESNITNMLAGKAAGVYVAGTSGQPGSNAVIRVRGMGTVNDNNPLYVADGQFLENINSVNPSDIANIEVLKDASSCAIYGSRGSNGVILITTKNGSKTKGLDINFDAYIGVKNSYKALDMMNSEQYYNFITTAYAQDDNFMSSSLEKFTNQYKKGYDTDWWKECTRTALTQNYNVSISNGGERSRSYLSIGYVDDNGALKTTYYRRLNANLKLEYDLNKAITIGISPTISYARQRDASQLTSFDFILKADPFTPVISPLVDPSSENYAYNKYAPTEWSFDPNPVSLLELPDSHNDMLNVFGNAWLQVKLAKGLTYRGQVSFERYQNTYMYFLPIYTATFSDDNLANMESKYNSETKLTNNSSVTQNYSVENRLNYTGKFGLHSIDAMLAMTYEHNDQSAINAFKRNALGNDEAYKVLDAQTTGDQTSGGRVKTSMMSYLGRINYSYADRYLLTASFRIDGSSRFAKGNRWGTFPAVAVGWRASNEKFFSEWGLDKIFSNMKIRAGWGINGNQRIDRTAALTLIGTDSEKQYYFGNGYSQAYLPTYTGNSDIKWEKDKQTNIGLDLGFFDNALNINMDFYVKNTTDMLLQVPIPAFGSFSNDPFFNAGELKNTGFDFSVDYNANLTKDLDFNAGVNLSTYKTEVTSLTSEYLSGNVSRTYVGGPIGRFYGYKQIGIFQNQEEIDSYVAEDGSKIQPNAKPGDFKFQKFGKTGALNDQDDRTFIGDPNPDLVYGFNLGFRYKDFDLSMAFQGTLGNDIYNLAKGTLAQAELQNALADAYTKAWTKEGDNATYPRMTNSDTNNNYRTSSFYVEDGSYLRLQNIQLGYNLPKELCNKTHIINSLRVFVSAQNLFTITGYSGLDPEIGVDNVLNTGYDTTHYPASRTITFGLNVKF